MTKTDKNELKIIVKEGALEALKSNEGRDVIKKGTIEALKSSKGQDAIADALKSEKAKDAILDVFVEAFNEVMLPAFEDHHVKLSNLRSQVERLEKESVVP